MANLEAYQEYQRIEDFEEDSPPGEEDLLVHVPEGLKSWHHIKNLDNFFTRLSTSIIFIKRMALLVCCQSSLNLVSFCLLSHSQRSLSTAWSMMSFLPIEQSTTPGQARTPWTGTKSLSQMPSCLASSALRG
uniref:Uncharacterized protein n=1 Tax=Seriola dumerili TaxID=41447 RepID=A0A3B4V1N5_SERDU